MRPLRLTLRPCQRALATSTRCHVSSPPAVCMHDWAQSALSYAPPTRVVTCAASGMPASRLPGLSMHPRLAPSRLRAHARVVHICPSIRAPRPRRLFTDSTPALPSHARASATFMSTYLAAPTCVRPPLMCAYLISPPPVAVTPSIVDGRRLVVDQWRLICIWFTGDRATTRHRV